MSILAIDLGKSKSVACVYESGSDAHRFETVRTTPAAVLEALERVKPERVVIEIGPAAGWVCDLCRELGVEVEVANTNHEAWRWKNVKRKSDHDDALKLARLSAMRQLCTVHVPAPGVRAWRGMIEYRHALVGRLTAVKNSVRAILTRQTVDWPSGQAGWSKTALAELRKLGLGGSDPWRKMLREELGQFDLLTGSIARIEEELEKAAAERPEVALLRTIPGVGPRAAEVVVAMINDPHRFTSGKQVGCYAGLTPRQYQSGSMDRQGRISGAGHTLLRSLLVEVSWLGRRHNPWMKGVYERALRGSASRKKIAIVALARRLLIVCWAMMRDGTPWRGAALSLAA
jgi:transposase